MKNSRGGYASPFVTTAIAITVALSAVTIVFSAAPSASGRFPLLDFSPLLASPLPAGSFAAVGASVWPVVYFNNPTLSIHTGDLNCANVYPVSRPISGNQEMAAVELLYALFSGPTEEESAAGYTTPIALAGAIALKSLAVSGGVAAVNLEDITSLAASGQDSACVARSIMSSIEATLFQLPDISHVVFAINGDPNKFYDWAGLSCEDEIAECSADLFQ